MVRDTTGPRLWPEEHALTAPRCAAPTQDYGVGRLHAEDGITATTIAERLHAIAFVRPDL